MFGSGCKHETVCEKTASPLASSMLLWLNRLSFLKPQRNYVNWSQSGSLYCFRATQDSPGVGLLRLWLHARLNLAPWFLVLKYENCSSVFPQPSSSWQGWKCQLKNPASQTEETLKWRSDKRRTSYCNTKPDERREVKRLEADFQLFTLTFLLRLFRIYSLVQITSAGHGLLCAMCVFFAYSASLLLPSVYVGALWRGRTAIAQPSHPPSPDSYGNCIGWINESTFIQLPSRSEQQSQAHLLCQGCLLQL